MKFRDEIEADIRRMEEMSTAIADGSLWVGDTLKPTPEEVKMTARVYAEQAEKLRAMLSRMEKRHSDEMR